MTIYEIYNNPEFKELTEKVSVLSRELEVVMQTVNEKFNNGGKLSLWRNAAHTISISYNDEGENHEN